MVGMVAMAVTEVSGMSAPGPARIQTLLYLLYVYSRAGLMRESVFLPALAAVCPSVCLMCSLASFLHPNVSRCQRDGHRQLRDTFFREAAFTASCRLGLMMRPPFLGPLCLPCRGVSVGTERPFLLENPCAIYGNSCGPISAQGACGYSCPKRR